MTSTRLRDGAQQLEAVLDDDHRHSRLRRHLAG